MSAPKPNLGKRIIKQILNNQGKGYVLNILGMNRGNKNDYRFYATIEELYNSALNCDIESFQAWNYLVDMETRKYETSYTEGWLFSDEIPREEWYDEITCYLKESVKLSAINQIKADLSLTV